MDPPGGSLQDHPSGTRRPKKSHALREDQSCEKGLPPDHRRRRGLPERRISDSDSESSDSDVVRWPTVPARVRVAPNAAADVAATSADADEGELPKPPEAARKRTLSPPPVGWSWRHHVDKKLVDGATAADNALLKVLKLVQEEGEAVVSNNQVFHIEVSKIKYWNNPSENLKQLFEAYVSLDAAIVFDAEWLVHNNPARPRPGASAHTHIYMLRTHACTHNLIPRGDAIAPRPRATTPASAASVFASAVDVASAADLTRLRRCSARSRRRAAAAADRPTDRPTERTSAATQPNRCIARPPTPPPPSSPPPPSPSPPPPFFSRRASDAAPTPPTAPTATPRRPGRCARPPPSDRRDVLWVRIPPSGIPRVEISPSEIPRRKRVLVL
jgi:hypothetical protein